MTTNAKIKSDVQDFTPGKIVELFILDATNQGVGAKIYFTAGTISGSSSVQHNGITYSPLDVTIEGMEYTAQGQLPTPTLTIGNVSKTIQAEVIAHNDLLGAKLTRRRTFEKYLDGQPEADSSAIFADDIYYFNRKTSHNKYVIKWELATEINYEAQQIPGRVVLRDVCTHRYRIYDGGFIYTNATCPYTGSDYFDEYGNGCGAADDKCGKRLSDCELRYAVDEDKPSRSFPGVAKVRV